MPVSEVSVFFDTQVRMPNGLQWFGDELFVMDQLTDDVFVLDEDGKITVDYGVTGLPVTFFVSREGRVIGRWVGSISEERLNSWVAFLMKGDFNSSASSGNNKDGFRSLN